MKRKQTMVLLAGLIGGIAGLWPAMTAHGQVAIPWYTIAGGGSTTPSTGGSFALAGTIGQAGAGTLSGGPYTLTGGFWAGFGGAASCYANCDGSTTPPILNVEDFSCFINQFAAAQGLPTSQQVTHYANCDQSTTPPVLNVEDFSCFINRFAAGCQ
jgi:hypothetical protein